MSDKELAAFKAGYILGLNKAIETPETDELDVIDLISGAENDELIRRLFLTSQGQNNIDTNYSGPAKEEGLPEGWKLVPAHPTDEMISGVLEKHFSDMTTYEWTDDLYTLVTNIYYDLLASAPALAAPAREG